MGLSNLEPSKSTVNHFVKKPQDIRQIKPESTVQAPGVQATIFQGVMPLDEHEPLTFQACHTFCVLLKDFLRERQTHEYPLTEISH